MRVNGSIFDPLRPERANPASTPAGTRPSDAPATPANAPSVKSDSVQISDAARKMATASTNSLDPARVADIRTKVLTGAYNTLDTVDQVARRIISRGDL